MFIPGKQRSWSCCSSDFYSRFQEHLYYYSNRFYNADSLINQQNLVFFRVILHANVDFLTSRHDSTDAQAELQLQATQFTPHCWWMNKWREHHLSYWSNSFTTWGFSLGLGPDFNELPEWQQVLLLLWKSDYARVKAENRTATCCLFYTIGEQKWITQPQAPIHPFTLRSPHCS